MIPQAQITQLRAIAPWPDDMQVEQDLILSRILVEIFSDPFLNKELAFRGGTALHKLFISPAARYSEDIDLVRTTTGPIATIADALRARLEPWLGKPKRIPTNRSFKLIFYFNPEISQATKQRIKIEINIQEPFSVLERFQKNFSVKSDWFAGDALINTFHLEELLATKLRALYQRSKGRDVFDLWLALKHTDLNIPKTIDIFKEYMNRGGTAITRDLFEKNLNLKLKENSFLDDISPLLSPELQKSHTTEWDLVEAAYAIKNHILVHLL